MLNMVNVENLIVVGDDINSGVGHAWNLVKINGNYYHVDSTWDAGNNRKQHFLKSDDVTKGDKVWDYGKYPKANKNYEK
ncbi:hypothetical protein I6N90_11140 [Paenibacillus sp. GSMTC-2017]|nr:hypothetical protein [Paenibacillus sp. GSMTC-2017]MBH5318363.1 hypothetical protein [Paenibacillus sp. GSMTC-2017]